MKDHRAIGILAAILFAFCITGIATAQEPPGTRPTPCHLATPNNALCVMWTAPQTNEDGTPIVLPISYRLERQSGSSWVPVTTTDQRQHYMTGLAPGTYTFRVLAIVNGVQSQPSNTASREATAPPPPVPQPPVIQVVQVVIGVDVAPVFTVTQAGLSKTWAGYARVGTACDGPAVATYLGYQWRKPAAWLRRKGISASANVAAPCA